MLAETRIASIMTGIKSSAKNSSKFLSGISIHDALKNESDHCTAVSTDFGIIEKSGAFFLKIGVLFKS
jgi:hypothetical protein